MGRPAVKREHDDEARLLEACRRGDRDAFQELFVAYKDTVFSIAYHFSNDEAMARDVAQQVFLKLYTGIGKFREEASFSTWLYRVVANACEDERRKRRRFVAFSDVFDWAVPSPRVSMEEKVLRREVSDCVREAIATLSPKLRMPIVLRYLEGLSYEEIAEALDCSIGTISSRLNRGHRILARRLGYLRGTIGLDE